MKFSASPRLENFARWILLRAGAIVLCVILAAVSALAQQDRGTILGTILDSSGAAIPNATVVVQNQETGSQARTQHRRQRAVCGAGVASRCLPGSGFIRRFQDQSTRGYQRPRV